MLHLKLPEKKHYIFFKLLYMLFILINIYYKYIVYSESKMPH